MTRGQRVTTPGRVERLARRLGWTPDSKQGDRVVAWRTPIAVLVQAICVFAIGAAVAEVIGWHLDWSADVPFWAGATTIMIVTEPTRRYAGYVRHRRATTSEEATSELQ